MEDGRKKKEKINEPAREFPSTVHRISSPQHIKTKMIFLKCSHSLILLNNLKTFYQCLTQCLTELQNKSVSP